MNHVASHQHKILFTGACHGWKICLGKMLPIHCHTHRIEAERTPCHRLTRGVNTMILVNAVTIFVYAVAATKTKSKKIYKYCQRLTPTWLGTRNLLLIWKSAALPIATRSSHMRHRLTDGTSGFSHGRRPDPTQHNITSRLSSSCESVFCQQKNCIYHSSPAVLRAGARCCLRALSLACATCAARLRAHRIHTHSFIQQIYK